MHAEHPRPQPGAHRQGGDRPLGPLADRQAERLADEVLVRDRDQDRPELTAVACLMMLERVNYLISAEIQLPENEMADRIADIMFAAFGLNVP